MLQASRIAAMDTTISADRLFGLCIYVFLFLNWLHHMDMDDYNGRPLRGTRNRMRYAENVPRAKHH